MKRKRYTAGGRLDPEGEYVCRRLMIHENDDEALEHLAADNDITVAALLRMMIHIVIEEAE